MARRRRRPRRARPARARRRSGSRTCSRPAAPPGSTPEREPVPGRARRPLPDRRGRAPTSTAAPRLPGLLRGRRVRLHRPPRRQPARLELAQRVLRVRHARGRGGGRDRARPPRDRREPPTWRFEPPTDETREAVWRLAGPQRDAAGLERLLDDPYPLARLIAARGARAPRVARRPPARATSRSPTPPSTACTSSSSRDGARSTLRALDSERVLIRSDEQIGLIRSVNTVLID